MDVAKGCGMKDKSFETAMNKIALQAEALQQKEAKDARRHRTIGHVKKACFILAVVAVAAVIFNYRNEIQDKVYANITPPKSKLGKQMITKLNVYRGDKHPHQAQKPQDLALEVRA